MPFQHAWSSAMKSTSDHNGTRHAAELSHGGSHPGVSDGAAVTSTMPAPQRGVDKAAVAELHAADQAADGTFGHLYHQANLETRQAFKREAAVREEADMAKLRAAHPPKQSTGLGYVRSSVSGGTEPWR